MIDKTGWVRIYPPPGDPDEIAREIVRATYGFLALEPPDPGYRVKDEMDYLRCERDHGIATNLISVIAAALRAYGASQRNAGLEEVLTYLAAKVTAVNPGELKDEHDDAWMVGLIARTDAEHVRSIKSTPESKPESKEPTA